MTPTPSDPEERARCAGTTQAGSPCRNYAVQDGRCRVHARAARRTEPTAGDNGAARPASDTGPGPTGGPGIDGAARAATSVSTAATPGAGDHGNGQRHASEQAGDRADGTDVLDALSEALGDELAAHLSDVGDFLRRRFSGDYEVDDFGLDPDLLANVLRPLLQPLYDHWWRVTSHDRDHLPDGGGLLVANHAGTLPFDGLMLSYDVHDATGRTLRELGANLVFQTPFVGHLARKGGSVRASQADADAILARDDLVAVFPEGFKGLGKPFSQRYQLERFGRGGFVATALRARVPIVPVAIVGSEEIYPIVWDARVVARALGLPYFPVVAQLLAMPLVGPLGLLPLPSKWSITYGEPIATDHLPREAADDPMVVFDLADRVRDTIQGLLTSIVMGRQSVFF